MEKLLPLVWIGAVLLAYYAIGEAVVAIRDAWRTRRGAAPWLLLLAALVAAGAAIRFVALPWSVVVAAVALAGGSWLSLRTGGVPDRLVAKARREESNQTFLHLVLLTGAVIFMVPFVWLLSTSLKDDEDIFSGEIRLIPRKQVFQVIDGTRYPLVYVKGREPLPGQDRNRYAKLEEDDANATVRPVMTDGTLGPVSKAPLDNVTKVKEPGANWLNYPDSLQYLPEETKKGLVYLANTVWVTVAAIAGTLLTASMVAFAFARLRWPGRDGFFVLLLSTMMLPYAVTMIPQFLIWQNLGFIDTLVPLWAGAFLGGGAFNIFLLRQFFKTIPTELEEAAKIDGCGYWRIFWTVMLPLVGPALATVAIMTFMGSWNNFMGPLIYISSPTKMTLAYALQLYQTEHGGQFAYMMAASTMVMIPVLVVFFLCQRYFIQGVTLTGIKG